MYSIEFTATAIFQYGVAVLVGASVLGAVAAALFLPWVISYRLFCYFRGEEVRKHYTFTCLLIIAIFVSVVYPTFAVTTDSEAGSGRLVGAAAILLAIFDYCGGPKLLAAMARYQK